MHEAVEFTKALAWPVVVLFIVLRFQKPIGSLLGELPGVARRLRSAQALGLEIRLERIGEELPVAEQQAQSLSLSLPPVPRPAKLEEGD